MAISSLTLTEIAADQKKRDPSQNKQIEESEVLHDRGHSAPPIHYGMKTQNSVIWKEYLE
ncbi:hypothetical protein [Sinorhizobium medicae]|uniref:Uncharacterized protein n=1 Tax=Sinorhizobium medicae TaxID=110321 RepID=A0A508WU17_9HYPH|nr:hypothetical protein [Sinorhizobium medicae]UFX00330.1 hypothetical protein SmedWSM1115_10940 [Sinorhizobium medicae WSM1115]VTZ61047.1 hypothetical protein EMEDMD4_230048 [Sinorhizobium medicae]